MNNANNSVTNSVTGFGDETSANEYLRLVDETRQQMSVPYQVAPGRVLELPSITLRAGDEVRMQHLADGTGASTYERMRDLVARGVVLHATDEIVQSNQPSTSPYRVARGRQSVMANGRIFAPGSPIDVADVGDQDNFTRLIGLGLIEPRDGAAKPSTSTTRGAARKGGEAA